MRMRNKLLRKAPHGPHPLCACILRDVALERFFHDAQHTLLLRAQAASLLHVRARV